MSRVGTMMIAVALPCKQVLLQPWRPDWLALKWHQYKLQCMAAGAGHAL